MKGAIAQPGGGRDGRALLRRVRLRQRTDASGYMPGFTSPLS